MSTSSVENPKEASDGVQKISTFRRILPQVIRNIPIRTNS